MLMMKGKTAGLARSQERYFSLRRASWRVWVAVAAVSLLALACPTAPPPRPISEADTARSSPLTKARGERTERLIRLVSDLMIPKVDGGALKLADLRGKVVVVDVWATFCPP